jgi:hypothetical protein
VSAGGRGVPAFSSARSTALIARAIASVFGGPSIPSATSRSLIRAFHSPSSIVGALVRTALAIAHSCRHSSGRIVSLLRVWFEVFHSLWKSRRVSAGNNVRMTCRIQGSLFLLLISDPCFFVRTY